MSKSCNNCSNALFADYGYSNYTVEGTEFYCQLKRHPEAPFDRFYGKDKRLDFAEECTNYQEGEPDELDVDGEIFGDLSDQAKKFWENN